MNDMQQVEILLAEDNETDAELTLRALEKKALGNAITWVKDGAEALDYLFCRGAYADRPGTVPKLVLLDIKMPKVDGIDVLRAIRGDARLAATPVVMLTSSAEESDLMRSYELGVNSYIVKPVDFDAFVDQVAQLGFYWVVMNRTP
ncbi:MAG: response regulator [Rhodospirillaceae bacterium]